jgi:hypothetical protein
VRAPNRHARVAICCAGALSRNRVRARVPLHGVPSKSDSVSRWGGWTGDAASAWRHGGLVGGRPVPGSWGMALGARGKHQRAADLAAVSAARAMTHAYPRLFEPLALPDGTPNPRHLSVAAYERLGRDAALQAGRRNGVVLRSANVSFPRSFAPTRVSVVARGAARLPVHNSRGRPGRVPVRARDRRAHPERRPRSAYQRLRGRLSRAACVSPRQAVMTGGSWRPAPVFRP